MEIDEYLASLENNNDDSSIEDAIADLNRLEQEPEIEGEGTSSPAEESEATEEQEPEAEPVEEPEPAAEPEKKEQSADANAQFAEQRRQKQIEERVQAELEKIRQESPEFKTAKALSEMYGQPIEVIHQQLEEARLQKQATEQNVPVEVLKRIEAERQGRIELQTQLNELRFSAWQNRVEQEEAAAVKEYPMLSTEDLFNAKAYLLQTLKNPDLPLKDAIYALHGGKIIEGLKTSAKNDALAEMSGRKKGTLPPQGGKSTQSIQLSDEELYVAKQMGLSAEEYSKWK